jgi:hypothetical protein
MKKIKLILAFVALSSLLFTACEKTTDNLSKVTNFPTFTMAGDEFILHPLGTPFTDPGVTATEGGKNIPVTVEVNGAYTGYSEATLDPSIADDYTISYTAKNSDGFKVSITRRVIVAKTGDLTTSIEGLYTSSVKRNGATSAQYQDMEYILIWKTSDAGGKTYELSDGVGGYYNIGRGYGLNYLASGAKVIANNIPANDFTFSPYSIGTFGGVVTMTAMTVDAGTKTINFLCDWVTSSTYNFDITLTQVPF